jgi:hypothetical protein
MLVDTPEVYFITFTCYDWMHLLEQVSAYSEVYQFLEVLKAKGITSLDM